MQSTPANLVAKKRAVVRQNRIQEADDSEIDFELDSPSKLFGAGINLLPLQNATAGPRSFYANRFSVQAMASPNREAPLVQSLAEDDLDGRSYDDIYGTFVGASRSKVDGTVRSIKNTHIELEDSDGKKHRVDLFDNFPLNRKSYITSKPAVKIGDTVKAGQLLSSSNYTDDNGTLALGLNARVGLVAYKGYSMDDATVVSESFAKRMSQQAMHGYDIEYKRGVQGGKAHHIGLFPQKFVKTQLDMLDEDGVIKPGMKVNPGDPLILATRPKVISSQNAQLGKLSSHMKNARSDASTVWEEDEVGTVTDVKKLRSGVRLNVVVDQPLKAGDKLAERHGQKTTVSLILPDEHMPRTADGKPLEMLLNPLSLPSRVNHGTTYEMLLGKVAQKTGKTYRLPGFNKPNEKWHDFVKSELDANGISDTEEVFDPKENRKLEKPITVGVLHLLKLHHTSSSKASARGTGSYDANEQPAKGGDDSAMRLSGLEVSALMSSGAYNVLRDMSTLRGQKNDSYWRELRQGHQPSAPGVPFVWNKFHALLNGAGYQARQLPHGKQRLSFWTDKDLDKANPLEVKNGELVDAGTLESVPGGLFDEALTGGNRWGFIKLPQAMPNPAAEHAILKLLGLTKKQYRAILAGEEEIPPQLVMKKQKV